MGTTNSRLDDIDEEINTLSDKIFGNEKIGGERLFKKIAKRIKECQKRGITNIYIYFGQGERRYCDKDYSRVYYSRQWVEFEELAKFISLYSEDGVDISIQYNPHRRLHYLSIKTYSQPSSGWTRGKENRDSKNSNSKNGNSKTRGNESSAGSRSSERASPRSQDQANRYDELIDATLTDGNMVPIEQPIPLKALPAAS